MLVVRLVTVKNNDNKTIKDSQTLILENVSFFKWIWIKTSLFFRSKDK